MLLSSVFGMFMKLLLFYYFSFAVNVDLSVFQFKAEKPPLFLSSRCLLVETMIL